VTTEPVSQATPVCYRHPNRLTRLSCANCGKPICVECSVDSAVGQKCPECAQPEGRYRVVEARRSWARPSTRSAPISFALIGVTVVIFIVGFASQALENQLFLSLAQVNALVAQGEWWRLVTAGFLHAGLMHILFNMWALYAFGPRLEQRVGSPAFLALYLSSAAAGGAAAYFLGSPGDVLVGASGAIFGLFGVWLWNAYRTRGTPMGRALFSQLAVLLAINMALPLFLPGISWQGHLGGLAAGIVIGAIWSNPEIGRQPGRRTLAAALVGAAAILSVVFLG
jgi:membrane associated rhomboid family serine protease